MTPPAKPVPTVVKDEALIFVSIEDGAIACQAIISDADEISEQLAVSFAKLSSGPNVWAENNEVLSVRFKPYALLDYLVDGYAHHGNRKVLDKDAKPAVDQLRKELQLMIDEIDGLRYEGS